MRTILLDEFIALACRNTAEAARRMEGRSAHPLITFASEAREIGGFTFTPIPSAEARVEARNAFLEGVHYLKNFGSPLSASNYLPVLLDIIQKVYLGRIDDDRRLVTASSPQQLGSVWLSANWERLKPRRLAANLLHEALHQMLYIREAGDPNLLRENSIAYSPWKQRERPGRWVWHAFWTFSSHCLLLSDSLSSEKSDFIADREEVVIMYLRLQQCLDSLLAFNVVNNQQEIDAIKWVHSALVDRIETGEFSDVWREEIDHQKPRVNREFSKWAQQTIAQHS